MNFIKNIIQELSLAPNPPKIIFPEGEEERIQKALEEILKNNICQPVLIGSKEKILNNLEKILPPEFLSKVEIIELEKSEKIETYAQLFSQSEKISPEIAKKIITNPLFFSALALKNNDVEGMIAGAVYTSGDVIAVSKKIIGLKEGFNIPSSFFVMIKENSPFGENGALIFADASVNINPTEEELAEIAVLTGNTAKELFGWEPRVVLLSFSTKGSAQHPLVEKVKKATELAIKKDPSLKIDGELQADAALREEVARKKLKEPSPVAGKANVLIFPDLNSANISYKLTNILGEYQALGPILQGFQKPISDLSRGVKPEEIVNIVAILSFWIKKLKGNL
ncbi:MAG: phosphate acyltransferase [Candidatus Paceibacterota bacterium]